MLKVIGYLRVSTRQQKDNGISLNGQRKMISEFVSQNTLRVGRWLTDADSARGEDDVSSRDGFNKATELSLKTKRPIIVATADRFSRSLPSYDRFIEAGGKVYSAEEGFGADEARMRASIARAEKDGKEISRRTKKGQALAKANGKEFGNPNIAEARARALEVRANNTRVAYNEISRRLAQAREEGAETDAELAAVFNDSGYPTSRGKRWTAGNLRRARCAIEAAQNGKSAVKVVESGSSKAIVDADGYLTAESYRRFVKLVARYGKDQAQKSKFFGLGRRILSKAQVEMINGFFERKAGKEALRNIARN